LPALTFRTSPLYRADGNWRGALRANFAKLSDLLRAKVVRIPPRREGVNVMGQKWTATLKVEFEMKDGQTPNRAESLLRGAVVQFRLNIVKGRIDRRVKPGSAKLEILKQGRADTPDERDLKSKKAADSPFGKTQR
jgi:hypothetical protein